MAIEEDKDQLSLLAAVYSAERSDISSVSTQSIAIGSIMVTYLVGVFIALSRTSTLGKSPLIWLASPVPIISFFALYTLYNCLVIKRTAACSSLETRIAKELQLDSDFGLAVSNRIMDPTRSGSKAYFMLDIAGHAPIPLAIISLIVYVLIRAVAHDAHTWLVVIAAVIYAVLLIPSCMVWLKALHP